MKHEPSGSSMMQFMHFKQMVLQSGKNPDFRMYDYGYFENKRIYGQSAPPVWNLANIKTKVRGFVGRQDNLGDVKDNSLLAARLNSYGVDSEFKFYDNCGHMTFMWSLPQTANLLFRDIISEIEKAT
jgi:pimeloyl-ACP methyl ester carboxylesterase